MSKAPKREHESIELAGSQPRAIGSSDVGPRDIGSSDIGSSDAGPRDVGASDVGATLRASPEVGGDVLPRGTALDESFVVEELLGRGAMGAVYLVRHRALGKEFAAKVVAGSRGLDPAAVARLRNEARMASAIDHENIVGVSHLGTLADGSVFVVMERLRGEDLRSRMLRQRDAEHPWLPDAELRGLVPPLLSALASAHAAGIVHRDLKPENIFLHHRRGRITPKLVDFGIGKLREPTSDLRLTATGQIVGTPLYMAPEQSRSSDLVDARSDLYTMGVVLFELLTGRLPFEATNLYEIVLKHVTEPPPDPRELRPDLPPVLAELVLRCLRKAPDERFQSAEELLEAWRAAWDEPTDAALSSSYDGAPPPEPSRESGPVAPSSAHRQATPTGPLSSSAAMRSTVAAVAESTDGSPRRTPWLVGGVVALAALALVAIVIARPDRSQPSLGQPSLAPVTQPSVAQPPASSTAPSAQTAPEPTREAAPTTNAQPSNGATDPSGEPTNGATTAEAPRRHRIVSVPPNARVFRDGTELGRTPFELELAADESASLELRLRGHVSSRRVVEPGAASEIAIELTRSPRRSAVPALAPR